MMKLCLIYSFPINNDHVHTGNCNTPCKILFMLLDNDIIFKPFAKLLLKLMYGSTNNIGSMWIGIYNNIHQQTISLKKLRFENHSDRWESGN